MSDDNLLENIFSVSDDDAQTFMDVMSDNIEAKSDEISDDLRRIAISGKDGKTEKIINPEYDTIIVGAIKIEKGWHADDYVWHISDHPRRPFRVAQGKVVHAIALTMNKVIPNSVEVKIYMPMAEWDIQEYTFKAIDLRNQWNVTEDMIEDLNNSLLEVLNPLTR